VLDMGEPVKILDLAKAMIELSGLKLKDASNPDGDIAIEITGTRPGEKLFEEMFIGSETETTEIRKIFVARESLLPLETLLTRLDEIEVSLRTPDSSVTRELLMSLVADGSDSIKDAGIVEISKPLKQAVEKSSDVELSSV